MHRHWCSNLEYGPRLSSSSLIVTRRWQAVRRRPDCNKTVLVPRPLPISPAFGLLAAPSPSRFSSSAGPSRSVADHLPFHYFIFPPSTFFTFSMYFDLIKSSISNIAHLLFLAVGLLVNLPKETPSAWMRYSDADRSYPTPLGTCLHEGHIPNITWPTCSEDHLADSLLLPTKTVPFHYPNLRYGDDPVIIMPTTFTMPTTFPRHQWKINPVGVRGGVVAAKWVQSVGNWVPGGQPPSMFPWPSYSSQNLH